jgi:anti-sigma factor RsiW
MTTITEDKLHAYADGLLPPGERAEVEAWLAAHPEDEARVRAWVAQNRRLHEAYDEILNEPVPVDLLRAATRRERAAPSWRAAAAIVAALITGGVGYGIGVKTAATPQPSLTLTPLSREAALAHVVFSPEIRHPVEVEARHADHLVAWLSKRLGSQLSAPDFSALGFQLLGGRLLSGSAGPVAHFMYEDAAGHRVTLYVRRDGHDRGETGFRHAREHGVEVFYWIDGDMGYALSGQVERAVMQRLADTAYRQLAR